VNTGTPVLTQCKENGEFVIQTM